jgi:membrane-associated phospholipid phosphatase
MKSILLHRGAFHVALLSATFFCNSLATVRADSLDQFGLHKARGEAKFVSGLGTTAYVAAGVLLPLLSHSKDGEQQSIRTADALLTSTLLTEGLKRLVREKRPEDDKRNSFPSGHATAAFTVAAMQAHYHPRQAFLWYTGATLIASSRVQLGRHYWHDVIAGAAVGYFSAKIELRQNKGLIFRPFIKSSHNSARGEMNQGFSLTKTF